MSCKVANVEDACVESDACTFGRLLELRPDTIVRDSFILVSPDECRGEKVTLGYTAVYPGCRTRGHEHEDREEAYFVVKGRGVAVVGDEEFEIREGDAFRIPFGKFHAVKNPHNISLEYVWVIVPRGAR
ncbi:MAG: cupin domain-containing protein [Bacillota bacterium]